MATAHENPAGPVELLSGEAAQHMLSLGSSVGAGDHCRVSEVGCTVQGLLGTEVAQRGCREPRMHGHGAKQQKKG